MRTIIQSAMAAPIHRIDILSFQEGDAYSKCLALAVLLCRENGMSILQQQTEINLSTRSDLKDKGMFCFTSTPGRGWFYFYLLKRLPIYFLNSI